MATAVADSKELKQRGEQLKRDGIVIKTFDLWKTYIMGDQEINAVSGVDITIMKGEYVAIMGPSGSGKSTLMNLIGCLDTPSKGSYLLNDKQVYGQGIAKNTEAALGPTGIKVVGRDGWDGKASNFRALANKIKASGADAVFAGGIVDNNGPQLFKDLSAAMPNASAIVFTVLLCPVRFL